MGRCVSSPCRTSFGAPPPRPRWPTWWRGAVRTRLAGRRRAGGRRRRGDARCARRTSTERRRSPVRSAISSRRWRLSGVAVVEMAQASGLDLVGGIDGNDPISASTYGTGGRPIGAAVDAGVRRAHRRRRRARRRQTAGGASCCAGTPRLGYARVGLVVACEHVRHATTSPTPRRRGKGYSAQCTEAPVGRRRSADTDDDSPRPASIAAARSARRCRTSSAATGSLPSAPPTSSRPDASAISMTARRPFSCQLRLAPDRRADR